MTKQQLIADRQQLIADRQQLITALAAANETIKDLRELVVSLQATISDLRQDIADLQKQNKRLIENLLCDRRKLYGRSSEQTQDSQQLLLFEDADIKIDEVPSVKTVNIKAHTRTASAKITL